MRLKYLIGRKIFLSPVEEYDVETLWQIKNSPFVRKYMSSTLPKAREDVVEEIKRMKASGSAYFVICENNAEENVIGYVILENLSNIIRAAELHLAITESYVGKGYGKEVIGLVTHYAIEELNIHSIRGLIRENNPRSLKCFESQGYRKIGTLPEWSFYDGKYNDCYIVDCIPRFLEEDK